MVNDAGLSIDELEYERLYGMMPDGGPIYAETNPEWYIVEPWNGISSLFILLPAIIWTWKLRKEWKQHKFLFFCLPLLFLGGLGSTLFHSFRSSYFFLLMDVLPTAILTVLVGIFLWTKVLPGWWYIIPVIALRFILGILADQWFSPHTAVNINYGLTGLMLFVPLAVILIRTGFLKYHSILISVVALGLSLVFRELDARPEIQLLPMGTHFLWHILSGVGAYYLAEYLFFLNGKTLKTKKPVYAGF